MAVPTKRQFGIWYVAGVGLALSLGLLGYVLVAFESTVLIGTGLGVGVALLATIGYMAHLFRTVPVSEGPVWEVAQWTALGIALSTLLSLAIGFGRIYVPNPQTIGAFVVGTITVGSGLGLWLVKWFVEQHDGDLRFEPNEPRGTVVDLEIPAESPPDRSSSPPGPA